MSAYLGVIGECLVDVVHSETQAPKAHVGGSPFNVAVGLARLDHDVLFAGRRGDDEHGRMIARSLRAQGITSVLEPDDTPTSVAKAFLDPTGQASYEFTLDWTLPPAEELDRLIGGHTAQAGLDLLHAGSIGAMLRPGESAVRELLTRRRETATISYDPNYRPSIIPNREQARGQVEECIALADVVQASSDDVDLLYPERSYEETMRAWAELGPALIILTRGASGALALAESGTAEVPAVGVDVADTVGAGDSFMAAVLSSLRGLGLLGASQRAALRGITAEQVHGVLTAAAQAAAITSSRFGAQPPTAEELRAALDDAAGRSRMPGPQSAPGPQTAGEADPV